MSTKFKNHKIFNCLILFVILIGCQLQEPTKNHGIVFLENRSNKLMINKNNKNDIIKIIGRPHATSFKDTDTWIYIERTLTKGSFHKLGQNVLKNNCTEVRVLDSTGLCNWEV